MTAPVGERRTASSKHSTFCTPAVSIAWKSVALILWNDPCDTNYLLDVCRPFIVIYHILIVHLDPVSPNSQYCWLQAKLLPLHLKDNPAADFNPWRKSKHIPERRCLKHQTIVYPCGGRHLFDCLISEIADFYRTSLPLSINRIQGNGLFSYKLFPFFPKSEAPFSTGFPRLRLEKNDTILTSNTALSGQN